MSGNRGDVWGLNETYVEASEGEWSKVSYASTASPSPKPWVADGTDFEGYKEYMYTFFAVTHFEKYDTYNDCVVGPCRAIQSSGVYKHTAGYDFVTATSNQDYAFITGTAATAPYSNWSERIIYRMDYSNDTASSWASSDYPRSAGHGVGNRHYGWFIGGYIRQSTSNGTAISLRSAIERMDYSNGTTSIEGDCSVSTTFAYVRDELNNRYSREAQKSTTRSTGASACNNDNAFIVETTSRDWPTYGYSRVINKYDFSNSTFSNLSDITATEFKKTGSYSASANSDYMWIAGGPSLSIGDTLNDGSSTDGREVHRVSLSSGTMATNYRCRTSLIQRNHGQSGSQSFGYLNYGDEDIRQRVRYANDTSSIEFKQYSLQIDDRYRAIFSGDGLDPLPDFFTGSASSPTSSTSVSQSQWSLPTTHPQVSYPAPPASSPASYFYFADGFSSLGDTSTLYNAGDAQLAYDNQILRFSYANDTDLPSWRGQATSPWVDQGYRTFNNSTNNANYAWLNRGSVDVQAAAGYTYPGEPMKRLDFSNDSSVSARNSGYLQVDHCASGNANYGWWFGGRGYKSVSSGPSDWDNYAAPKNYVYRTDYSNDTNSPALRATTKAVSRADATTNGTYAWIYGGCDIVGDNTSTLSALLYGGEEYETAWDNSIHRYDFSNDTSNSQYRADLSQYPRRMVSGTNAFYNYSPPNASAMRAVGNNSMAVIMTWFTESFINSHYPYPATGSYPSTGHNDYPGRSTNHQNVTHMQKYDYSNDTVNTTDWAPQDTRMWQDEWNTGWDATGNNDYGYFQGRGSYLGKLDYASSTPYDTLTGRVSYLGAIHNYGIGAFEAANYPSSSTLYLTGFRRVRTGRLGHTAFSGARNQ